MSRKIARSRSPSPCVSEKAPADSNPSPTFSAQISGPCSPLPEQILTKELPITSFNNDSDDDGDDDTQSFTSAIEEKPHTPSLLYPPTRYLRHPRVDGAFSIDITQLANALEHIATIPLLDKEVVFPWMHEFPPMYDNEDNEVLEILPPERLRSIIIVKVGGDLSKSKIKGAIDVSEIVDDVKNRFRSDAEMVEGKARHYKLQIQKFASVSDIVVYGDEDTTTQEVEELATRIVDCQHRANEDYQNAVKKRHGSPSEHFKFHTFILTSPFPEICEKHPELVYIDSAQQHTPHAIDMLEMEKRQISLVATPTEIAENVWVGCLLPPPYNHDFPEGKPFNIYIDTQEIVDFPEKSKLWEATCRLRDEDKYVARLRFPGNSYISIQTTEERLESLIEMCRWIYQLSSDRRSSKDQGRGTDTSPGVLARTPKNLRVYIHCLDGYSEISFLSVAYVMFAKCLRFEEALFYLHRDKKKEFYLQYDDAMFFSEVQRPLLIAAKETFGGYTEPLNFSQPPSWVSSLLTCLPCRITPYLYLGNLKHANQPKMLKELGIDRILSVGEPVTWSSEQLKDWGVENLLVLSDIHDDGYHSLFETFDRALEFIDHGRRKGMTTLVHCRVGVSRSATICIAEVMATQGLSLPEAFCFVRARRLNVIVQPNLLLLYDLMRFEERLQRERNQPVRRPLEWHVLAREIHLMNRSFM